MRPHIEMIHESDYIWHPAELPHISGEAVQRNLSVDEEDGSAATSVLFREDTHRPSGYHVADTEWFVLEGSMTAGVTELTAGGYIHIPRGTTTPPLRISAETRALVYREGGDWSFELANEETRDHTPSQVTILDTETMAWTPVESPEAPPGHMIKNLHRNPDTGFFTCIIWAKPGWARRSDDASSSFRGSLYDFRPNDIQLRPLYAGDVYVPATLHKARAVSVGRA